jgi:hypothetical protein
MAEANIDPNIAPEILQLTPVQVDLSEVFAALKTKKECCRVRLCTQRGYYYGR